MGKKANFLILAVLALMIATPLFASAALVICGASENYPDCEIGGMCPNGTTLCPADRQCLPADGGIDETQPCTLCHLFDLAQKITNWLTTIIAPAIAVLAFSIGGFKILMSGPNPGYRAEGIKAIRNGIIGLLIVFGAWIIVNELLLFVVGNTGAGIAEVKSLTPWTKISCIPAIKVTEEKPAASEAAATGAVMTCSTNKNSWLSQEDVNNYNKSQDANWLLALNAHMNVKGGSTLGPAGLCQTASSAMKVPSGCTSLAYLPNLEKLILLQQKNDVYCANNLHPIPGFDCEPAQIVITGGTECGHQTHGFKTQAVDLSATTSLGNYILGTALITGTTPVKDNNNCDRYDIIGMKFTYEGSLVCSGLAGKGVPLHWHVTY